MSTTEVPRAEEAGAAAEGFASLAALQDAHDELLDRRDAGGDPEALLDDVERFLRRGRVTGAVLDAAAARRVAQGVLSYWATALYRAGRPLPEATLAEFDPTLAPELPDDACPYVGLYPFGAGDHERFFGRGRLVEEWVGRLASDRLLAVVGSSGSGKSSLVLGGLVPALRGGALPAAPAGATPSRSCPARVRSRPWPAPSARPTPTPERGSTSRPPSWGGIGVTWLGCSRPATATYRSCWSSTSSRRRSRSARTRPSGGRSSTASCTWPQPPAPATPSS